MNQHKKTWLLMEDRCYQALACHFGGDQSPLGWPYGLYKKILGLAVMRISSAVDQYPILKQQVCPDCSHKEIRGCKSCNDSGELQDRFEFSSD